MNHYVKCKPIPNPLRLYSKTNNVRVVLALLSIKNEAFGIYRHVVWHIKPTFRMNLLLSASAYEEYCHLGCGICNVWINIYQILQLHIREDNDDHHHPRHLNKSSKTVTLLAWIQVGVCSNHDWDCSRYFMILFRSYRRMPEYCLKLGHNSLLQHPFQLIIYYSSYL